ncbi:uncharacterized protein LOC143850430 [Tasmannia lanceolata]|uniref:uncharacterized protein LOC143850430 n=1 Tax=Tasmannia lanceolata TaxID=3420 RepID=UPI004062C49B
MSPESSTLLLVKERGGVAAKEVLEFFLGWLRKTMDVGWNDRSAGQMAGHGRGKLLFGMIVVWKAIQNKMSTKDRLTFLPSSVDRRCVLCSSDSEFINHLFFKCGISAWIWRSLLWRIGFRRKPKNSLVEEEKWIRENFKGKGQRCRALYLSFQATIYHIWKERNLRIFEGKVKHKTQILREILQEVCTKINSLNLSDNLQIENIKTARLFGYKFQHDVPEIKYSCWTKPGIGEFKLNSDASLEDFGTGIGGLIRDSNGMIHALFSVETSKDEVYLLELQAILMGTLLALSKQVSKIWIEADSLIAVDILNKKIDAPWKSTHVISEIRRVLNSFESWRVTHCWRESKAPADYPSKRLRPCKGIDIIPLLITPILMDLIHEDREGTIFLRS